MKRSIKFLTMVLVAVFTLSQVGPVKAAPAAVNLGTASGFAILAGTPNITDVPNSVITGNVGLSPATGAGIGLTQPEVTGTIYAVDAAGPAGAINDPALLTIAKNDLTAAYTDVANRTPVLIVPTELGGTTKTAGVYASDSTTFGITAGAGPLVLDGQGDPNSVFIFEVSGDAPGLTVGNGSVVSLINGASACNVYWRVISATIGTTAVFKGTILALNQITVANGANIEGRLLARNANVTLDHATITASACAAFDAAAAARAAAARAAAAAAAAAGLPKTGSASPVNNMFWYIILPIGIVVVSTLVYVSRKKSTI